MKRNHLLIVTSFLITGLTPACNCGDGAGLYNLAPQILAEPSPLSFGTVVDFEKIEDLTIRNDGDAPLEIQRVILQEGSDARFMIGIPSDMSLGAGQSSVVSVAFAPTTSGSAVGVIEIHSNDPDTPILNIPLDAIGQRTPVVEVPEISVCVEGADVQRTGCDNGLEINFGTLALGVRKSATVIIKNTGTGSLEIISAQAEAGTSPEITFDPQAVQTTLTADESTTVIVEIFASAVGTFGGSFLIVSNDIETEAITIPITASVFDAPCGDIQGRICDITGNGPAVGATVYVEALGQRHETTTDSLGDWQLTCVPPGSWTFQVQNGSWSTSFVASVTSGQLTTLAGEECLDPESANVAVVWGEYDQMQDILAGMNVPYTLYMNAGQLVNDATEMAKYDIIFFNCGWDEALGLASPGLDNIRNFVESGSSIYTSDLGYDVIEVGWPTFVDYLGDDNIRDDAEWGPLFFGFVDVVDPALRTALGGLNRVEIESLGTAIQSVGPPTRVYLQGDRLSDGGTHPVMVSFQPDADSGRVFFTDFHNAGQPNIALVFDWLIQNL